MARDYTRTDAQSEQATRRHNLSVTALAISTAALLVVSSWFGSALSPLGILLFTGLLPGYAIGCFVALNVRHRWIEQERRKESVRRNGAAVLGSPPERDAFAHALANARERGKTMIDRYLVGFELDSGKPIWVTDEELCGHGAVFAKTGFGKTLWLEGLMFQQMARGRASGFTFIDAKRDPGTLADIILMALITGRIEDLIVVDPFDPVCAYNFVFTTQRPDVKARKVLRCGLPPTSDQSTTKHYDRLAADAVYRVVRAMESLGLAWSVRDVAVALSAFTVAYPRMRQLLHERGSKQAMVELGHLASSYRTLKGGLDSARLTDNLRGISSELHSISNSEAGEMFCTPRADLSLTDAILRGKCIYYMLPRLEEAESAARMVKVFREDLEVSIGEVTSSRVHKLEDPHMVIIDEGASTFGPTWANLFELARKGRFALLFGAQSVGGLMDSTMGLSEEFYERVMANVNLKVIMRIGDNRTAQDMSEWIGLIKTSKKSISTGLSTSTSGREYTKRIEINKRTADSYRDGITIADSEEELVSAEELKHEMSAEKGLAYFDKGDGIVRKGRSIWFDAELPGTWEGREYLTKYEAVEADEIGLAEWVDEHIFSIEEAETERNGESVEAQLGSGPTSPTSSPAASTAGGPEKEEPDESGPFRLNPFRPFRGKGRSSTFFAKTDPSAEPTPPPTEPEKAPKPPEAHNTEHRPEEIAAEPVVVDEPRPAPARQDVVESKRPPIDSQNQSQNHEETREQKRGHRDGGRGNSRGHHSGRQQDRGGQDRGGQDRGGQDRGRNGPQQNSGSAKGERPQQGNQSPSPDRPGENKMVFRGSRKDTVVRTKKVGM